MVWLLEEDIRDQTLPLLLCFHPEHIVISSYLSLHGHTKAVMIPVITSAFKARSGEEIVPVPIAIVIVVPLITRKAIDTFGADSHSNRKIVVIITKIYTY